VRASTIHSSKLDVQATVLRRSWRRCPAATAELSQQYSEDCSLKIRDAEEAAEQRGKSSTMNVEA